MKAYKLTDQSGKTRKNTQWGENVTHEATGTGKKLCSNGYIHFYTHPLLAVMMNAAHSNFPFPLLWEGEAEGRMIHEPLKSGSKRFTTIKTSSLPEVSLTQKIAFGILCSLEVCKEKAYVFWANKWLSGEDRSHAAAYTAAAAYASSAAAAYAYAAYAAAYTAAAASKAASSAAADYAAYAAEVAKAAEAVKAAAAYTAAAASYDAYYAEAAEAVKAANANAAAAAAAAAGYAEISSKTASSAAAYAAKNRDINFLALAQKSLTYN